MSFLSTCLSLSYPSAFFCCCCFCPSFGVCSFFLVFEYRQGRVNKYCNFSYSLHSSQSSYRVLAFFFFLCWFVRLQMVLSFDLQGILKIVVNNERLFLRFVGIIKKINEESWYMRDTRTDQLKEGSIP